MAKLTFWGATKYVTGSCYLIETDRATVLLECGLIQGSREAEELNREPFPFDRGQISAAILSHAHLDHSGRIPKLVRDGYAGPVYMTRATCDLIEVMLKDAAYLNERDVQWENKRRRRAGKNDIQPLYTIDDVQTSLDRCRGLRYGQRREIAEGIEVCFRDAGHILGSAIVELFIRESGKTAKLVFSGDLGNSGAALLRDPETVEQADVLLLESTYGNRDHRALDETLDEFRDILAQAGDKGGNVLIPAFAVGRTQEIIFRLGELYQRGELKQKAVFLDSPMAIATTEIYHRYQHLFNPEDSAQLLRVDSGSLHTFLPPLRYSHSTEESMAINRIKSGAVIIAGSGMCNGGRIRHHLKHNVWRQDAHVLIIGFQAIGTPGRALVDGVKTLRMAGEELAVRAAIHTLGGFSAHAGQSQLMAWAGRFKQPRPELYLVHGEQEARKAFQHKLSAEHGWEARLPAWSQTIRF